MENKIRNQHYKLLIVLFLAITVVADKAQPKESKKFFKIGKALVLSCTPISGNIKEVKWQLNGKPVDDVDALNDRYKIIKDEGHFVIDRTHDDDAGIYTCLLNNETLYTFDVYASVYVKVPENSYVVEHENLNLTCIVVGTKPEIKWTFKAETENNTAETIPLIANERFSFEPVHGVANARLLLNKTELSDRGHYTCIGFNDAMTEAEGSKSESYVRVKDKLAALWPFLGICAEVFVLCAIILIYEKRRNKTDLDESDTDQSPDQLK